MMSTMACEEEEEEREEEGQEEEEQEEDENRRRRSRDVVACSWLILSISEYVLGLEDVLA